jgi:hypothetical protein
MGVRLPKHVFLVCSTQSHYVWALGFRNRCFQYPSCYVCALCFQTMFFPVSGTRSHHVWALGFQKTFLRFLVPNLVTYGRYASETRFSRFPFRISLHIGVRIPKHIFPVSGTQSHYVWTLGFRNRCFRFPVPDLVTYAC